MLVAVSVLTVSLAVFFRVPFLPTIGIDVGMSDTQLAAITTIFATGRLIVDIPAGRFADTFHPHALMSFGVLVAALGSFVLAWATDASVVYAAALLLGISSGVSNTSGLHFFSTSSRRSNRGASVSIYSSVLLVGQASGPPIAALLATLGDWRMAHMFAGTALLVLTAVLVSGVWRGGRSIRAAHLDHKQSNSRTKEEGYRMARIVLHLLPFLMFGAFAITVHTLVPIIGDDLGLTISAIGLALGIGGVFRFIAIVTGGQIADRVARKAALIPAIVVTGVGVGLLAVASDYQTWLISIVAVSMGSIAISVSATVIADLAPPGRTGRGLARWRVSGDLGFVVVPLILGWVFDKYGPGAALIPMSGLLVILSVLAWAFIPETREAPNRRRFSRR